MAPTERTPKRQKLSPVDPTPSSTAPNDTSSPSSLRQDGPASPSESSNRSSWYNRTWPRKAAPITQVARESISSASNTAIETASVIKDKVISPSISDISSRRSSLALTLGKRTSGKALPVGATTTIDHAMPQSRKPSKQESVGSPHTIDESAESDGKAPLSQKVEPSTALAPVTEAPPNEQPAASINTDVTLMDTKQDIIAPRSWIGWLARSEDGTRATTAPVAAPVAAPEPEPEPVKEVQKKIEDEGSVAKVAIAESTADQAASSPEVEQSSKEPASMNQRRSWLPIWNNSTAAQSAPVITSPAKPVEAEAAMVSSEATSTTAKPLDALLKDSETSVKADDTSLEPQTGAKPSAWIFWSREKPVETTSLKDVPREGEIAVANTETESHPRRASIGAESSKPKDTAVAKATESKAAATETKKKHESKASVDTTKSDSKRSSKTTKVQSKGATATGIAPEVQAERPASPAPSKKSYDHLLLPSFQDTLKLPENPTLLQQLSRLFYSTKEPDMKHVNLIKDTPKIKNALVIGVHGYFPTPLIRSVIGQPTGTSIKFADMAAQSIQRWTKKRGYECQVKSAALEGEGRIAERIDLLWKLLLNWIDEIRKSDFIMVACHSQGVPVAMMLVAKLIHFGCITASRVGICAMAGINMGPFPEFKSRWISGSAGELFEFTDPTSKVSADYLAALEDVLKFGVKITYVGSIDDQLVSLESSIFAPVSHPHIYRAVSIDSRSHAPDFVSHLVAFALKLRNLGVQDHGLIRELSVPLAGSLYTGEGHSRLYEDGAIYDLAVSFALETSSRIGVPLSQRPVASTGVNPFILPFAMRGILEEDFVKSDLQSEASLLLQQFDDWKPMTKALKDVKFRLEGIRSKL